MSGIHDPADPAFGLDRYVYENSAQMWPHIPLAELKLVEFVPAATLPPPPDAQVKTFTGPDAVRLYDSIAFAMHEYGVALNAHITIVWRGLSVHDQELACRILAQFNKEAAAWLRVGGLENRERRTQRSAHGLTKHIYAYVHERTPQQGFHTHQLMFIPPAKAKSFEQWAIDRLTKLSGRHRAEQWAIHMAPRKKGVFTTKAPTDPAKAAATTWRWYRYLIKSLNPLWTCLDDSGQRVRARDVLKAWPYRAMLPIWAKRVAGTSENISVGARPMFRSRFDSGPLATLYAADELIAYERRRQLETTDETIRAMFPNGI
jgi:hypothetical protein